MSGLNSSWFNMVASSSTKRMTQRTDRSGITQDLRKNGRTAARTNDNLYHGRPEGRQIERLHHTGWLRLSDGPRGAMSGQMLEAAVRPGAPVEPELQFRRTPVEPNL